MPTLSSFLWPTPSPNASHQMRITSYFMPFGNGYDLRPTAKLTSNRKHADLGAPDQAFWNDDLALSKSGSGTQQFISGDLLHGNFDHCTQGTKRSSLANERHHNCHGCTRQPTLSGKLHEHLKSLHQRCQAITSC